MISEYFQEKFGLTQEASKNLIKGIISTVAMNIALMFPMGLYVFLLYVLMNPLTGGEYIEPNLGLFIFLILIVAGLIFYTQWKQYYYVFNTTYDSSIERRVNLAESIRELPLSFFEKKDLSDLSATIMGDCTSLEHVFSHAIPQLLGSVISLILIAIGLFNLNVKLTIALLWVVPVSFILLLISKKLQSKHHKDTLLKNRAVMDNFQEGIDQVRDIQSYNYQYTFMDKVHTNTQNLKDSRFSGELIMGIIVTAGKMFLKLGTVSVIIVGISMLLNNQIDLLTLLIFIISSTMVFSPIEMALEFLAEIFVSEVTINRMKDLESQVITGGKNNYSVDNYDVHFENVSFSYDNHENVIDDISFTAKQNEVTALIGPSGSGKSTVSKLAANFWNPNKGTIKIDDVDITTINNEKILENYSIVFQDVILFNNSIYENIKIGKKDATKEEIEKVAKLAQCEEFIKKLPDGYNTLIGENGVLLSGGQRQRISIARALLKDAPIIILDEATSFLDVENETLIQEALNNLIKNKTVIIIAHRMRTIQNADKLIVLKDGKIFESGTPEELYNKSGLFKHMLDIQTESNKWEV